MSRLRLIARFVLALVVFLWLSAPFAGLLTPPDPSSQIIGIGVGSVVTVPLAVWFTRRSYSLERLCGYLFAVNIVVILVGLVGAGVAFVLRTALSVSGSSPRIVGGAESVLLVLVAYLLSFHLVYRGGYDRLKARFA